MKDFSMRLLALLALAFPFGVAPGCATFDVDPDTGELGFSPQGAARDARAFAVVARGAAEELAAKPDLQRTVLEVADDLEALADAWDAVAVGEPAGGLVQQIDAILELGDLLLVRISPSAAEEWGPYVRAVQTSLRLALIYGAD